MRNINIQYQQKARSYSALLNSVPFVKAIILNGSVAKREAKVDSDIDLLIIARRKRIFTVRFFCNLILVIAGQKRPKNPMKPHGGKFCLNYFLTDNYLRIPTGRGEAVDKYCAQNYAITQLLTGSVELYKKFIDSNEELFKQYCREKPVPQFNLVPGNPFHDLLKELGEYLLLGSLGDWFESILKKIQIRHIERDPRSKQFPDFIVYNDHELRFHPPK